MPRGIGSLTPFTAPAETRVITFDFGSLWAQDYPNLAITSIKSVTCALAQATPVNDPFPPGRIIGPSLIVASPSTFNSNQAVAQQFGNLVAGAIYVVSCSVNATDGSSPVLWNYLTTDFD